MDTVQIRAFLSRHRAAKKYFLNVYPSDGLPKEISYERPRSLVFNTDPHHKPGTHWAAMFLDNDRVTVFDSLAEFPEHSIYTKPIFKYLKKVASRVEYNKLPVQDSLSITCGEHCIYFICKMSEGLTFRNFLNLYSSDKASNDRLVTSYMKEGLKPIPSIVTNEYAICQKCKVL